MEKEQKCHIYSDSGMDLDMFDQTNEIVCLFDIKNKKILYLSSSFHDLWEDLDVEDVFNDISAVRSKVYPEDADKLIQMAYSPESSEWEYRIKGDQERWFRTIFIPVRDQNGNITRKLSFTTDITYWKTRGKKGSRSSQMDFISQIAAAFAHEIRNPLTTIKGFLQLLSSQEQSNPYYEMILQETEKIDSIINEFIVLTDPDPKFDFHYTDVRDIVSDALYTIQTINPEMLEKNVHIFVNCETELPMVHGSPAQLKLAFFHLIKNAVQAVYKNGSIFILLKNPKIGFCLSRSKMTEKA
ncbi:histidine kinase dimerization/phospho-acceptor domain-containing protein [Siminovitchia sediminis]|uniref:histidine kinase n=1 Tax=Siminovitchia sediminis TaxID=1274353 RepID=A0ABW4KKU0_9BACI